MPNKKQLHEYNNFRIAIHHVLKQVHPGMRITLEAVNEVNLILHKVGQKITQDADLMSKNSHRQTVTSRDIQSAVRLNLGSELAKHAVSEGTKAVTKYSASSGGRRIPDGRGGYTVDNRIARNLRAGLQFQVSRGDNVIRNENRGDRVSEGAPVYLTAVLEYLCAEFLELAGNAAKDLHRNTITTRHISLGILNDEELRTLIEDHHILLSGGVLPFVFAKKVRPKK